MPMNLEPYYFAIAISLHVLAAVIWVGGMFFAYMALRPVAAKLLEPAVRLSLWARSLSRFFFWVWLAVIIIPVTGYWMIFSAFNGFAGSRLVCTYHASAGNHYDIDVSSCVLCAL